MFAQYTIQTNNDPIPVDIPNKYIDTVVEYSNFIDTYNKHNDIFKEANHHLDSLMESYTTLSELKNNVQVYGINEQFKQFILPDFKDTSLEYSLSTNNGKEFVAGLESVISTTIESIRKTIEYLYNKVLEFINWIMTSTVVLRERVTYAFNKYQRMEGNVDIAKVPHSGVWSQVQMKEIVNKTKDFKYKLDSIKIEGADKIGYTIPQEIKDIYQELKTYNDNNKTTYPKAKRLGEAGFRSIRHIQTTQLANTAHDAIVNIASFKNIYNKLKTEINLLNIKINRPINKEEVTNNAVMKETVAEIKEYYNACKVTIDLNVSIINQYCTLLRHFNTYMRGESSDATDDNPNIPAQA